MNAAPSVHYLTAVWSHRGHLPLVLQSLEAQDMKPASLTVVDNASGDDVRSWLASTHPQIACLRNFNNQGIARGLNQAIRLILEHQIDLDDERYLAFVAPDVVLSRDAIRLCVEALQQDQTLGAVSPIVFVAHSRTADDGERTEVEPTQIIDHAGLEMLRSRRWRWRQRGQAPTEGMERMISTFGLSGSCFVIRASLLNLLRVDQEWLDPLFSDDQLFLDLSWRLHLLERDTAVVTPAFAWHIQTDQPRTKWSEAQLCTHRLCRKNDTFRNRFAHLVWRIGGSLANLGFLLRHPSSIRSWFHDQIVPRAIKQKRRAQKATLKQSAVFVRKQFSR